MASTSPLKRSSLAKLDYRGQNATGTNRPSSNFNVVATTVWTSPLITPTRAYHGVNRQVAGQYVTFPAAKKNLHPKDPLNNLFYTVTCLVKKTSEILAYHDFHNRNGIELCGRVWPYANWLVPCQCAWEWPVPTILVTMKMRECGRVQVGFAIDDVLIPASGVWG
ncbi:uncharacterized protein BDV17DRAFT_294278 [Aspergillus undulatus]|uniref:uncharacterized protein n=1 Tax=Aspergillus undulatus TaxID=1810928 RepID=UPI003CCCE377